MTDPKDKDQKTKIPYEPPRLFDLGGGVAYAQAPCKPGGSPGPGACRDGSTAGSDRCTTGVVAGGPCKQGNSAIGLCKAGGAPL
jgi:hypothetical protein